MNNISIYRKKAKLTQTQLGELSGGLTQTTIHNYENGKRVPSIYVATSILHAINAKGVKVEMDQLFPCRVACAV